MKSTSHERDDEQRDIETRKLGKSLYCERNTRNYGGLIATESLTALTADIDIDRANTSPSAEQMYRAGVQSRCTKRRTISHYCDTMLR